jgi:hypothetical protein
VDQKTGEVVWRLGGKKKLLSATQGSVQVLPGGNAFVGWDSAPVLSEFGHGGELLFGADLPTEGESYRSFRFPWEGHPEDAPAIAAEPGPKDRVKMFASWNGATEVATCQVFAGPVPDELEFLASAPEKVSRP